MAFRSDDHDDRWPQRGTGRKPRSGHQPRSDSGDSLSLYDTLRELAVTIIGFVGVILLITAVLSIAR
ncbi:MAG TPA: hypothetical protein VG328_26965 [Stellaceae bacterium]|jgi:hypothetical protein|nr:hypothetical protein [Stellaceae bacterium]